MGDRWPWRQGAAAFAALAAAAVLSACAPGVQTPRWNVIVVTVDTLRADHLPMYGYERDTTPALAAWAEGATVFRNAYAVSAWTFPGLLSTMTGRYPARHGYNGRGQMMRDVPTLQTVLAGAGYRVPTLTHVANLPGIRSLQLEERWRVGNGRARDDDLLAWLATEGAADEPFFAWTHWRNIHLPYDPPAPYDRAYGEVPDTPGTRQVREYVVIPAPLQAFAPGDRQAIVDLYDGLLLEFDAFWRRLLQALEDLDLSARTVVVLTADHGEELLDHGLVGHASTTRAATLFEEVVRVPLLLWVPGAPAASLDCPVSQIDVLPTVLGVLGLPLPAGLDGVDLGDVLRGEAPCPDRALAFESIQGGFQAEGPSANSYLWGMLRDGIKLVTTRLPDGSEEQVVYDLGADPLEARPRAVDEIDEAAALQNELAAFRGHHPAEYWRDRLEESTGARRELEEIGAVPVIRIPQDGDGVVFTDGYVRGEWSGSPLADYVLEYDVGTGLTRTTGTFETRGTSYAFGPVPAEVWNNMAQFQPWRVRVWPRADPDKKSAWVEFRLEPLRQR